MDVHQEVSLANYPVLLIRRTRLAFLSGVRLTFAVMGFSAVLFGAISLWNGNALDLLFLFFFRHANALFLTGKFLFGLLAIMCTSVGLIFGWRTLHRPVCETQLDIDSRFSPTRARSFSEWPLLRVFGATALIVGLVYACVVTAYAGFYGASPRSLLVIALSETVSAVAVVAGISGPAVLASYHFFNLGNALRLCLTLGGISGITGATYLAISPTVAEKPNVLSDLAMPRQTMEILEVGRDFEIYGSLLLSVDQCHSGHSCAKVDLPRLRSLFLEDRLGIDWTRVKKVVIWIKKQKRSYFRLSFTCAQEASPTERSFVFINPLVDVAAGSWQPLIFDLENHNCGEDSSPLGSIFWAGPPAELGWLMIGEIEVHY
jgi:hypothetical protein